MTPSAVFVPAVALQTEFRPPANFLEILGVCQRRLHMLCRPRESIWPGSLWKYLWSVREYGVDTRLLLAVKSLYSCSDVFVIVGRVKPQPFTVGLVLRQAGTDPRGERPPLKPKKVSFFHHDFVEFGRKHSRYKGILPSIVLSPQCCEVYFISLTVVNP